MRCADVAPTNGLAAALDAAAQSSADIVIDDPAGDAALSTQENPQNGTTFIFYNYSGGGGEQIPVPAMVVQQANGPEILVLPVRSFTLKNGTRLRVAGVRAFAIASHLDIFIAGTLDGSGQIWGPGASTQPSCNVPAQAGALGGAGSRDDGGASSTGAPGGTNLRSGNPGLIPLVGGCASGYPMGLTAGGAVELVSRTRVAFGPTGVLTVAGRGGAGRISGGQLVLAGGGSGGAVRLEAPSLAFAQGSRVVGRGGSGAAANTNNSSFQNGVAGDADLAASSVPGATCSGCGVGGNGGTASAASLAGQGSGTMIGSGGGSVGRAVLATRSGVVVPPPGTLLIGSQQEQIGVR